MTRLRSEPIGAVDGRRASPVARDGVPEGLPDEMPDAGPPATPATEASPGPTSWPVFLGLAAVIAVADQATKLWLTSLLAPGQSVAVIGDLVRLVHSQNTGGLFGLLRGQALVFGLVSMVVIALIVVYHARTPGGRYLSITLGLLLGGAIGNLIDRLRLEYVVDFVDIGIGGLRWYTFNVADAAISFSLVLLVAAGIWPQVALRARRDG